MKEITVKEFGASSYLLSLCSDLIETVKEHFPYEYEEIVIFSLMRLFFSSPLKNVQLYYLDSHISDVFPSAHVSARSLSELLFSIGRRRGKVVDFLKNFVIGSEHIVIDLTSIFSFSEDVISATSGYNSKREYTPQINLVLMFSLDRYEPSFFRIVAGSIRDVSAISLAVKEAGIKRAILIADKGIYSKGNIEFFEREGIDYILPLRRDSSLIDYEGLKGGRKGFDGYFLFSKRVIWHYEREVEGRMFINFVSLLYYYRIYRELMEKGLLKGHTPKDLITHLIRVRKLKIGGEWILSEIPKKTREIMKKLGIEMKRYKSLK